MFKISTTPKKDKISIAPTSRRSVTIWERVAFLEIQTMHLLNINKLYFKTIWALRPVFESNLHQYLPGVSGLHKFVETSNYLHG